MLRNLLLISLVHFGKAEQISKVYKRKLADNISLETVKLLDFHDENVIESLAKSVVQTESDELVEQILYLLSDSNIFTNRTKLRTELKKMIKDPKYKKIASLEGYRWSGHLKTHLLNTPHFIYSKQYMSMYQTCTHVYT